MRCVTTLTGFKWIARAGGNDGALVYGYEQALGYAVRPDLVADKDGISAALLVLQLAAGQAREGRTLADRLDDLAVAHGVHVTGLRTVQADGATGLAQLNDAVERVRKDPPRLLAGQPVTVTDLREGAPGPVDLAGGHAERSPQVLGPRPRGRADLACWRRRPGDDPAERHRARAQDLRRGRLARAGAGRARRRAGERRRGRRTAACGRRGGT